VAVRTRDEVEATVAAERRLGQTPNLSGWNLAGVDLSGLNLTDVDLSDANLTDSSLQAADLTGTRLARAVAKGANLSRVISGADTADWVKVDLEGANLNGCILSGIKLTLANLKNATLVGADLCDTIDEDSSEDSIPHGTCLQDVNLEGANLTSANLYRAALCTAHIEGADFTDVTLARVISGGVTGTPAALPPEWHLLDGHLIGPQATLVGYRLTPAVVAAATDDDAFTLSSSEAHYWSLPEVSNCGPVLCTPENVAIIRTLYTTCDLTEITAAAESETVAFRMAAAQNPATPPALLRQLACDPREEVAELVTSRDDCPEDARVLAALTEHEPPF